MNETKVKMEVEDEAKVNVDLSVIKEMSYEEKLKMVSAIASPMAPKKFTKRIYKCIKKGKNINN
jgi:hypothetical protein